MTGEPGAALVVSAGPGLGGAVARRFARENLVACVVRRKQEELAPLCAEIETQGGRAIAFGVDARDEDQIVAHVIVDGAIDMPWIRENFPQIVEERGEEALLAPDAIAESYWQLYVQPRSSWTHELDLRPHIEPW